jgi:hypothetical protein
MKYPKFELRLNEAELSALRAYSEGRRQSMATVVRERLRDILDGEVLLGDVEAASVDPGAIADQSSGGKREGLKRSRGKVEAGVTYSEEVERMASRIEEAKLDKPNSRKWLCKCGVINFGVVCVRCALKRE